MQGEERPPGAVSVELILYVNPASPSSSKARRAVETLMAAHPGVNWQMTVRDVANCGSSAEEDRILFTPTLVVRGDGPPAWVVGDMGDPDTLAALIPTGEPEERS